MDQAASLRAWALEKTQAAQSTRESAVAHPGTRELVVTGLAAASPAQLDLVYGRLEAWQSRGYSWVGQPHDWVLIPLALNATAIDRAQCGCKHWALWIDNDIRAFDKGYRGLKLVSSLGGPSQLLALHEPGMRRKGLLDNLANIAAAYFGIQLVVLAH